VTVLEVIQRSTEFLARKGVEAPRLQVELLAASLLKMPRLKLYLNFDRALTEPELETLRGQVKRRGEREPLQHILGSTSFCGLEMLVNRDVLIPRPETELLAERAWQRLSKLAPHSKVLDFGTGSGCLAVTLAVKCPQAEVHALDVSESALNVARENASRHQVAERIHFYQSDGFEAVPREWRFDLLVGNPPYVPSAEIERLEAEVRDHDPRLALDGGKDGLEFYRRLAVEAALVLAPSGLMMLEFGDGQAEAVEEILQRQHWQIDAVEKDYSGRARILIAHR
jgi:release factor glutamine methyltransferase